MDPFDANGAEAATLPDSGFAPTVVSLCNHKLLIPPAAPSLLQSRPGALQD
jgi:hypothetical protein